MQHWSVEALQALVEEDARRRQPVARSDRDRDELKVQQAGMMHEFLRREYAGAGFDLARIDQLIARQEKAREKLRRELAERAIAASFEAARRFAENAPVLPVAPASRLEIIERVTFIRSFIGQGTVLDQNIGTEDNWARYELRAPNDTFIGRGEGRLSFFTLWHNRSSEFVLMAPGARLRINARLSVNAPRSLGKVDASCTARINLWDIGAGGNKLVVFERRLAAVTADGGFFTGDDDSRTLEVNEFMSGAGAFVAPGGFALIEVELLTDWHEGSGSIHFDAQGGAFRIEVPHLILTLS